jgi:ABC-type uncharacterized transport system involved in gliding motility auxiliary subunit
VSPQRPKRPRQGARTTPPKRRPAPKPGSPPEPAAAPAAVPAAVEPPATVAVEAPPAEVAKPEPPPAAGTAAARRSAAERLWDTGLPTVLALAGRDLAALFLWPPAYAICAAVVVLVAIPGYVAPLRSGQPVSMEGVLGWAALVTAVAIPLVTMRLIAAERRSGALEQLLASPVRLRELVAARWLAGFVFFLATIAFTLVEAGLLVAFQPGFDAGAVAGGCIGIALVGSAWVAIGLLASSLTRSRVTAVIVGAAALLVLQYALGAAAGLVSPPLSDLLDYAGAANRALSFERGQLVLRDAVYFAGLTAGALVLTVRVLASRRMGTPGTRWLDPRLAVAALAVVAALVAANAVAARAPQAADLTRTGQFTLATRSVQVTRQLGADLVVTGLFRPDELAARRDVAALLDLYREQSPRVQVRFVDPDQDAALVQSLGSPAAGSLVLQYRTRPAIVLGAGRQSESDVTAAIARLESGRAPVVCWATGDGERDLGSADDVAGYSAAAALLRASSYRTRQVRLGQGSVPATCDALAVLGPTAPLNAAATQAVQAYLAGGGKLLLAVDPWLDAGVAASADGLLQPYGAAFDGGLVVEPDPAHAAASDSTVPVVSTYGESPITSDLGGGAVFFPAATPIVGTPAATTTSAALASSTGDAYAIAQQRTDLGRRAGDRSGPFELMRSIEQGGTRIVVAGTSALAENRTMPPSASGANPDLLLASLDWLTGQDALLSIPSRPQRAAPLSLAGGAPAWNVLIALPLPLLAVLVAGSLVYVRRRR